MWWSGIFLDVTPVNQPDLSLVNLSSSRWGVLSLFRPVSIPTMDPEAFYTRQNCIGKQCHTSHSLICVDKERRRRKFWQGVQGASLSSSQVPECVADVPFTALIKGLVNQLQSKSSMLRTPRTKSRISSKRSQSSPNYTPPMLRSITGHFLKAQTYGSSWSSALGAVAQT